MNPLLNSHGRETLVGVGDNPERDSLLEIRKRAANAMQNLCKVYTLSLKDVTNGALCESQNDARRREAEYGDDYLLMLGIFRTVRRRGRNSYSSSDDEKSIHINSHV